MPTSGLLCIVACSCILLFFFSVALCLLGASVLPSVGGTCFFLSFLLTPQSARLVMLSAPAFFSSFSLSNFYSPVWPLVRAGVTELWVSPTFDPITMGFLYISFHNHNCFFP
uniref:Uncharacterized protein n=1 Tax=Trypanosoma congolense (strain IL3000) TaxID=1068625 RepID=G0UL02_TRYCI|nr:hypothetical protein, unlikely [Trypanosoma congolense IL3000]